MKGSWKEIILNLLFWSASVYIITSGFSIERQEIELINGVEQTKIFRSTGIMIQILVCAGVSLLMFYGNLWNVTRLGSGVGKTRVFVLSCLFFLAAFGLFHLLEKLGLSGNSPPMPYSLSLGITAFYFTISTAYGISKVWLASEQQRQQLQIDKKQAELNLLRNQLQPHFLFNALNNLLSMVDQDKSPQLADAFDRLSRLLRYVIDETQNNKVSISQEIDFIRNYATLQLLRYEKEEVAFRFQVEGEYTNQAVEPGLFIPFVENAFKYGTEPEQHSSIAIQFGIIQANQVAFTISNSLPAARVRGKNPGTGINATRERLNLAYPNKHSLQLIEGEDFRVDLKIDTK